MSSRYRPGDRVRITGRIEALPHGFAIGDEGTVDSVERGFGVVQLMVRRDGDGFYQAVAPQDAMRIEAVDGA